ncbi:MAG: flp pilus-assembly TadE/G-like family protein, partial [Micromonosporaceae bacterium]|nr:flp pilus-assembly TadE/G-like family protein [Micromonosporaceae bacterium]
ALGLCLISLASGVVIAADGVVQRHRASTAADLGALAGARLAASGEAPACGRAAVIVAANEARMIECELDVLDLVVTVESTVESTSKGASKGASPGMRATARAGPARAPAS